MPDDELDNDYADEFDDELDTCEHGVPWDEKCAACEVEDEDD